MKLFYAFLFLAVATFANADHHKTISTVMKDGLKGKESPMAKLLGGTLDEKGTKELNELVKKLGGTEAPRGEQKDYETKVNELIAALAVVAEGEKGEDAIARLKKAQNCKACHSEHKPED